MAVLIDGGRSGKAPIALKRGLSTDFLNCASFFLLYSSIHFFNAPKISLNQCFRLSHYGDISNIRKYKDLPEQAKKYIKRIEEYVGVPIKYIGVGAGREEMIVR